MPALTMTGGAMFRARLVRMDTLPIRNIGARRAGPYRYWSRMTMGTVASAQVTISTWYNGKASWVSFTTADTRGLVERPLASGSGCAWQAPACSGAGAASATRNRE